ncbi:hypothetical protein [Desulfatibacillum aliphaticivorans]|uniref:hypothetical protein n=1 Tax=Desulfatibacillum aliphaticivorans TaxID=218208 RepID=UPI00040E9057|nr:hypothetical protein [Desulfatibacillum aliphaticivorans]
MSTKHQEAILEYLEKWAMTSELQPMEDDWVSELTDILVQHMYKPSGFGLNDQEEMEGLREQLIPLAARLRKQILDVPLEKRQAMEVCSMVGLLRSFYHTLTKDDPLSSIRFIHNGEMVLEAVFGLGRNPFTLNDLCIEWPILGNKPSKPTVSRVLGSLEEAGYVQRDGITKGQTIRLTARAFAWAKSKGLGLVENAADISQSVNSGLDGTQSSGIEPGIDPHSVGNQPISIESILDEAA